MQNEALRMLPGWLLGNPWLGFRDVWNMTQARAKVTDKPGFPPKPKAPLIESLDEALSDTGDDDSGPSPDVMGATSDTSDDDRRARIELIDVLQRVHVRGSDLESQVARALLAIAAAGSEKPFSYVDPDRFDHGRLALFSGAAETASVYGDALRTLVRDIRARLPKNKIHREFRFETGNES